MSEEKFRGSRSSVLTRQSLQAFTSLCTRLQTCGNVPSTNISAAALEDELGRFRVWAGNIGAIQRGHSSLEYRLREAPIVLESVLKLLEELCRSLDEREYSDLRRTIV
jgi:hypothetical protein